MDMITFTTPHWQTLAIFDAIPGPLAEDVLEVLSPLHRLELSELLRKAASQGLLREADTGQYSLSDDIPPQVLKRLKRMNTQKHAIRLVIRLNRRGVMDALAVPGRIALLIRAGYDYEAAILAEEAARKAVQSGDRPSAIELLKSALTVIDLHQGTIEWDTLFLSVINELVRIKINIASRLDEIPGLLSRARMTAERIGDRRTLARCDLVMGLYHYVIGRTSEGLSLISAGLAQAEAIGDEDIMAITAEFRGIYSYLKGMYKEAVDAFDLVVRSSSMQAGKSVPAFLPDHLASSSALGYVSALLGQYHRAIGVLDSLWRRTRMNRNDRNACFYEALLGIVLIITGRKSEAHSRLNAAQKEALEIGNLQALHVAKKGLAYHAFLEGRIEDAFWITMNTAYTESIGPQYNWPIHLEMLYTFEKNDLLAAIPSLAFEQEMERVLSGPNYHLRGVALRIRALQSQEQGKPLEEAFDILLKSEAELLRTGDHVELAKTRAEMARVKLGQKDRPAARNFALMAWEGLSGYGQDFFPDDLVPLLRIGVPHRHGPRKQDLLDRFMDLMDGFVPGADLEELLNRLVATTSRFFGAERGALFWFAAGRDASKPVLRAAYNMDRADVSAEAFRESLKSVFRVFRNAEPLILKGNSPGPEEAGGRNALSLFCLPVVIRGEAKGVLYLDNSYIDDETLDIDRDIIIRMSRQVSTSIERIFQYAGMIEADRTRTAAALGAVDGDEAGTRIIGSSPVMQSLLSQADQAAASEATVLITGETGVGKELLARRIHEASERKEGPFVVVNLSSIPETLVESELFGHEKGAFTGADRRKPGRVEMADRGTLFIDEIGDVPSTAQVKLLRVIQEKNFERLGGIRTMASDFRLVAATNRDLAREVAEGRFRRDLYYRLNVVPLVMPPLRERGEDVIELAREFLKLYARKYHRVLPDLEDEDTRALTAYPWPGNVRELKNVMERAAILSSPDLIRLNLPMTSRDAASPDPQFGGTPTMDEIQRRYIMHVLHLTGGRIGGPGGAAEVLGMKRTTLQARMRKLGIRT